MEDHVSEIKIQGSAEIIQKSLAAVKRKLSDRIFVTPEKNCALQYAQKILEKLQNEQMVKMDWAFKEYEQDSRIKDTYLIVFNSSVRNPISLSDFFNLVMSHIHKLSSGEDVIEEFIKILSCK